MDWVAVVTEFERKDERKPRLSRVQTALRKPHDALARGHEVMQAIRRDLAWLDENYIYRRTYDQICGQDLFLSCFARLIYGVAVDKFPLEIMAFNRWDNLGTDAAIKCPRRWGKSILTGILLAVIAWHVPNIKMAIFAGSARQGDKNDGLIGIIQGTLIKLSGHEKMFTKADKDHLWFNVNGNSREIRSFAASDKLRFYSS